MARRNLETMCRFVDACMGFCVLSGDWEDFMCMASAHARSALVSSNCTHLHLLAATPPVKHVAYCVFLATS